MRLTALFGSAFLIMALAIGCSGKHSETGQNAEGEKLFVDWEKSAKELLNVRNKYKADPVGSGHLAKEMEVLAKKMEEDKKKIDELPKEKRAPLEKKMEPLLEELRKR